MRLAPTITTDRLILRGPKSSDFETYAAFLAEPRTQYMGGPFDRAGAWTEFATITASWALEGYGGWIVVDRTTGTFCGDLAIVNPPKYPEPEIGWSLTQPCEGKGFAFEAASAALQWWWANSTADTVVSYIHVDNARSMALAKRLGAQLDPDAPMAEGDTFEDTVVYRHRRPA